MEPTAHSCPKGVELSDEAHRWLKGGELGGGAHRWPKGGELAEIMRTSDKHCAMAHQTAM